MNKTDFVKSLSENDISKIFWMSGFKKKEDKVKSSLNIKPKQILLNYFIDKEPIFTDVPTQTLKGHDITLILKDDCGYFYTEEEASIFYNDEIDKSIALLKKQIYSKIEKANEEIYKMDKEKISLIIEE